MPPDDAVMKEERTLLGLESRMIDELNVNAQFEVERPKLGPLPDYAIFAEVRRSAEEQMLIRRIVKCGTRVFSLCLIGIIAHNAYRYVNNFKSVEFDNNYITPALIRKDKRRKNQGKAYIFPLRSVNRF